MTTDFDQISAAQYVLLTTYRKDGTPKPLPTWAAKEGGELLVWTLADSWKVKRIRNTPRVTVQACDRSGQKPFGPSLDARAVVLDVAGTKRAKDAIAKKYGIVGWLGVKLSDLRGRSRSVGVAITEVPAAKETA